MQSIFGSTSTLNHKKRQQRQTSSWDIPDPFQLTIYTIEKLNCLQSVEVAIQGKVNPFCMYPIDSLINKSSTFVSWSISWRQTAL